MSIEPSRFSRAKLPRLAALTKNRPFRRAWRPARLTQQILPDVVHPVIVLPGLLGSWPPEFSANGGKLDPITGAYANVMAGLERIGYVPGVSLFPFPYDWRQGVEAVAQHLGQEIERIGQLSPEGAHGRSAVAVDYSQVDLIAHSLGGLVCRAYIQSDQYNPQRVKVARLAMVATPNGGSVAAYHSYEGGETSYFGVSPRNAKTMIGLLEARTHKNLLNRAVLTYRSARGRMQYDLQAFLSQQIGSVRDLLPMGHSNYLYKLGDNGEKEFYPFGTAPGYPINLTIEKLNTPEELARLDQVGEICCFYSHSHATRCQLQVADRFATFQPLYEHGYPLQDQPAESFGPGDNLVTVPSAMLELPAHKPDGAAWQVQVTCRDLNALTGKLLNHVQVIAEPEPVRHLLGYLAGRSVSDPITAQIWDGPPLRKRRPNYRALAL